MVDLYVALHHPGAMTALVVIQARLGSTRLPGKVLLPLAGKPVLQHVVERAQRAGYPVVVACPVDDFVALIDTVAPISGAALSSAHTETPSRDVLSRFAYVVEKRIDIAGFAPDIIVRLTADCPCLDPTIIQRAVQLIEAGHDYAGNTRIRSYPRGLDVEAFTTDLLMRAHREAVSPYDREHVTPWMQRHAVNPGILQKLPGETPNATTSSRWCLDTPEDYAWLQEAFTQYHDPTTEQLASVRPLRLDYA